MKNEGRVVLGLVGLPGSGKSSIGDYLQKKGFVRITLSDVLRAECKKRGIQNITREILQDLGNEFRRRFGPHVLAKRAIARIQKERLKKAVIDGIRNLEEIAYLRKNKDFLLIGVTAPQKIRYMRLAAFRGKAWVGSFAHFVAQERREETLGTKTSGLRVRECLRQADTVINNSSTKRELNKQLSALVTS